MPKFSSNRTKIFTTFAVIVVVTGGLVFLGVNPLLAKVKNTQDQIKAREQKLKEVSQAVSDYQQLQVEWRQISDQVPAISGIFPVREDSVNLVQGLEKAVQQSGLSAQLLIVDKAETQAAGVAASPPVVKNLNRIEEIPYSLRFSGDYRKTVNLIIALENIPFFTELTNISFSADTAASSKSNNVVKTGTATGEIQAILFIKKP